MEKTGSKCGAIFLASILIFSTFTVATLMGSAPNAYAGGGGGLNLFLCNSSPISDAPDNDSTALTYWGSEKVFLYANYDDLYRLSVDGTMEFIDDMDHDSKGLAFNKAGSPI